MKDPIRFTYVYLLESVRIPGKFYSGITDDLHRRLLEHNRGACAHTRKAVPWRIKTAVAYSDREQARKFEIYLKSPSGRAFAKKRL